MTAVRLAFALACLAAAYVAPAAAQGAVRTFAETGPEVGSTAPDFSLPVVNADSLAEPASFSLFLTRGQVVVLAFFPRAFMSGSDAQFERFRELAGEGTVIVGLSDDPPVRLARYAAVRGFPFLFAEDAGHAVAKRFGLMGKKDTAPRRGVYVIDRLGAVAYRDVQFDWSADGAYARLRAAVLAARR